MNQSWRKTPLLEALRRHAAVEQVSLHVPGHKAGLGLPTALGAAAKALARFDLTEVPGLDDLYQPTGPIAEAQALAAACYGSRATHFLVGGSTVGNLAAIVASVERGQWVIVSRHSHQSVWHGLQLVGARALVITPELLPTGAGGAVFGPITPNLLAAALAACPEAVAVILTSPTYPGVVSPLRELVQMAHQAGLIVVVDEAHGAHLTFHPALPESAVQAGADLVVQSLHKMTAAFTQTGLLHRTSERVSGERLMLALQMVQTSSPSYLLLASIDAVRAQLATEGERLLTRLLGGLQQVVGQLENDLPGLLWQTRAVSVDPCKWLLVAPTLGYSGTQLAQVLQSRYQIWTEWADEAHVLCAWSYANGTEDPARLLAALRDAQLPPIQSEQTLSLDAAVLAGQAVAAIERLPQVDMQHRRKTQSVSLRAAVGERLQNAVTVYPPGVPLVLPGEALSAAVCACLEQALASGVRVDGLTPDHGVRILMQEDR